MASFLHFREKIDQSKIGKNLIGFFPVYFALQVLPIDYRFFRHLVSFNWLNPDFRDIFYLTRYSPTFTGDDSFLNWLILAFLAAIGTFVLLKPNSTSENTARFYYWVRIAVRYRLALAVIGYGFLKFYPIQSPVPSFGNLNTSYGDFTAWKLFSLGLGVVPGYQSFLGLVEIIAGLLLLNRKTATLATLIILPFTGNVAISNIAYEGGEYVYAFYLVFLALYLFAFDAVRLFNLLSLDKPTQPDNFKVVLTGKYNYYRIAAKIAFIGVFVLFYGFKTRQVYYSGGYHFPKTKGLENIRGIYNVSEFKWNGDTLAYSLTDPVRWQNVVFEDWNTLSIESNKPVELIHLPTEEIFDEDSKRIYEIAGTQGRHYYSYSFDEPTASLLLQNRNPNHKDDRLTLSLQPLSDSTWVVSGTTAENDSIYAVLNRLDKKYLTFEAQKSGRRSGLKL